MMSEMKYRIIDPNDGVDPNEKEFIDELASRISVINELFNRYGIPDIKKNIHPLIFDGKLKMGVSLEARKFLSNNSENCSRGELPDVL